MLYKPEDSLLKLHVRPGSEIVPLGRHFYSVPKFNAGDTDVLRTVSNNAEFVKFFNELVTEAARIINIPIESLDKNWLAQLLTRFHQREEFLDMVNSDGTNNEKDKANYKYLVDMAVKAMEARETTERAIRLLKIGDQALFSVGFFPERIVKQMGEDGLNYYENMSRSSYAQVADITRKDSIRRVAYQVSTFRKVIRCICTSLKDNREPYAMLMMVGADKIVGVDINPNKLLTIPKITVLSNKSIREFYRVYQINSNKHYLTEFIF